MSNQYLDQSRQSLITETTAAIRTYLDQRAKSGHTASYIPALVYEFFGSTLYDDGLENYPQSAAVFLAALTKKEVSDPIILEMGEYYYSWVVVILKNVIELSRLMKANPANIAEFEYHEYENYDPNKDVPHIQRDLSKYRSLLRLELEMEAADVELKKQTTR